jgi:predicted AlkP superfamily pyrophosphatase or phosphodiesterase
MPTLKGIFSVTTAVIISTAIAATATASPKSLRYQHILLISIDGMHAIDLTNYIAAHPKSTLAELANAGVQYPNALTTAPSDSFPGLLAQVTGGTSKSSGVFYDDSFDRTLFAPGSNCAGAPGTESLYDESIDVDSTAFDAGGTLGDVVSQINAANLPMTNAGGKCQPVYPHSFLKVNTIFEVIRVHGGQTAWADKHPAYDIVNGPSGAGVQDLFTPEVDSNDATTGMTVFPTDPAWFSLGNTVTDEDTTTGYHSVARNDLRKVHAVLNEIDGFGSTDDDHSGPAVGVPTIMGMNFQAVSVGQKLRDGNSSDPLDVGTGSTCGNPAADPCGGYVDAVGKAPNLGLAFGLDFVDSQIGAMVGALGAEGLSDSTLIIVSAKHGQSPIDLSLRTTADDSPYKQTPGIAQVTTDDVALLWLDPASQQADYQAAKQYLESNAGLLGITTLLDKSKLAPLYGNPFGNNRTPDFIGITEHGLIYTSGSKLAEHGGFANDDRNVALLLSNPGITSSIVNDSVETRQIASTILSVLGINKNELDAARKENTKALPGDY